MHAVTRMWHRLFVTERPSVSLSLFRWAVAITVGCHMIPSFLPLADNYLATAFKTHNPSFFPLWTLQWVAHSSDAFVQVMVACFVITWLCFLMGYRSQVSCILMTLSCYYFYALNDLHIGTLSFDILLVTLILMCVTPYHGDAFSWDAMHRGDATSYRRARPFHIQRLLQIQMATTYFCTGLNKITAGGNWLTENPLYYLVLSPAGSVVREFWGRGWLAQHPSACYAIGIFVICSEFLLPLLWFIPRTRWPAILYGWFFHAMLLATLHVPTIFFFLFPTQMLLFLPPERAVAWIERRRQRWRARGPLRLIYDGQCQMCLASVRALQALDVWGAVQPIDYQTHADVSQLHPSLTRAACHSQLHLIAPDGRLWGGYDVFQRLTLVLPALYVLAPLFYLPPIRWLGHRVYRRVAAHRYWFHRGPRCADNQCVQ